MHQASLPQRKRGFRIHATVFVATVVVLIAINLWIGPPYWVVWTVPGWAIGLLAHWFFVLGPGANHSSDS